MEIKIFQYNDFLTHKEVIQELLSDLYSDNFSISKEYSNQIASGKIIELETYIKENQVFFIGLLDDHILAGFAWVFRHHYYGSERLHVNQIIINNAYRGKGLGKSLMNEIEKIAKNNNIHTIDLFVTESNHVARKMYEQLGFETERRYLKKDL